jgi:hypothetical protein
MLIGGFLLSNHGMERGLMVHFHGLFGLMHSLLFFSICLGCVDRYSVIGGEREREREREKFLVQIKYHISKCIAFYIKLIQFFLLLNN